MNDQRQLSTQEVIVRNRQTVRKWVKDPKALEDFEAALGGFMSAREFIMQLLISFQDDKIALCTPESQFACMRDLASLCFVPRYQHAALIPRRNKKQLPDGREIRVLECTWMAQWQGLQSLICRHPAVRSVRAVLVHRLDKIAVDGLTDTVTQHYKNVYDPQRVFHSMNDLQGGYLHIDYYDRPDTYHHVHREVFEKARKCAQTDDIWRAWFSQMCYKTIFRDAYARRVLPMDPVGMALMQKVLEREDTLLGNDPRRVLSPGPATTMPHTMEDLVSSADPQQAHTEAHTPDTPDIPDSPQAPALEHREPEVIPEPPTQPEAEPVPDPRFASSHAAAQATMNLREQELAQDQDDVPSPIPANTRQSPPSPTPPEAESEEVADPLLLIDSDDMEALEQATTPAQVTAIFQATWGKYDKPVWEAFSAICSERLRQINPPDDK